MLTFFKLAIGDFDNYTLEEFKKLKFFYDFKLFKENVNLIMYRVKDHMTGVNISTKFYDENIGFIEKMRRWILRKKV